MTAIKNNAPGMRGVNTEDQGLVMLMPGETRDLKVSAAELKSAKLIRGLEIGAKETSQVVVASNVEDTSATSLTTAAATLHPMPPGQDPARPEEIVDNGATVAPWAVGGGPGSAAESTEQLPGGETTAAETAEAQQSETMTARQPAAKTTRAAPAEKG